MFFYDEKEKERSNDSINIKENDLKKQYLHIINNTGEGTMKQELYEIFKDELDLINNNFS